MIERTSAYKTSDGQTFSELEDAKHHELTLLYPEQTDPSPEPAKEVFANLCMGAPEKVVDILTMGPRSLPKARKVNGGRKNRPAKTATPESAPTP